MCECRRECVVFVSFGLLRSRGRRREKERRPLCKPSKCTSVNIRYEYPDVLLEVSVYIQKKAHKERGPVGGKHADGHNVEALSALLYSTADGTNEDVGRVVRKLRVLGRLLHVRVELVVVLDRENRAVQRLDLLYILVGNRPEDDRQLFLVFLLKRLLGLDYGIIV